MFSTIITWFLPFLCICLVIWSLQKIMDRIMHRPPGPFRFPIIGCMPQVLLADLEFPFVAFEKLSKYYGNIIYVQFGLIKGVAINGYDALNEIFRSDDWIGRMDDRFLMDRTFGKPLGLITSQVDIWRESRQFSTRCLREFGFGVKRTMDGLIQEELADFSTDLLQRIQKTNGILSVDKLFNAAALNISWSMVSGTHYSYDDPKLTALIDLINDYTKSGSLGAGLLTSFPFLIDWAPKLVGFDIQAKANRGIQKYLKGYIVLDAADQDIIEETRAQGDYLTNPSNFIEVFLQKIDTRESTVNLDDIVYSDENLISILYDFFMAGAETTSSTLAIGLLHMVLNPDIQEKVREEIMAVIGGHRSPSLADKEKMPFVEATILEILRVSTVLPISPRKLHVDATVGNYRLPKGTTVYANIHSASMDKEFWGDPEVFRPEHFLSPNGKIVNSERIFPFGAGKRNCIGESVARSTIFILFTGLIQKFKFEVNPAEGKPTLVPILGFSLNPAPFTTLVTPIQ